MIIIQIWLSLMVDAAKILERGYGILSEEDALESSILMVTEPSDNLVGSPAIFIRGGDRAQVLAHYRKIIAANSSSISGDRQ